MRGQGLAILGLRLAAGGTVRRVCAYGKKKHLANVHTAPCAYVRSHVMRSRAGASAALASLLFERQQLDCCATDTPAKLEDFVGLVKVVQQAW